MTEICGTFFDIFTRERWLNDRARSLISSREKNDYTLWHVLWGLHAGTMAEREGTFFGVFTRERWLNDIAHSLVSSHMNDD